MNPMAKKAQLNNCHWWSSNREAKLHCDKRGV